MLLVRCAWLLDTLVVWVVHTHGHTKHVRAMSRRREGIVKPSPVACRSGYAITEGSSCWHWHVRRCSASLSISGQAGHVPAGQRAAANNPRAFAAAPYPMGRGYRLLQPRLSQRSKVGLVRMLPEHRIGQVGPHRHRIPEEWVCSAA